MSRRAWTCIILALLLIPGSAALTYGQQNGLSEVLTPVTVAERPRLEKRLRLFMKYQKQREWQKLFELIDKANARHVGREKFPQMMNGHGHLDFVPERTEAEDSPYNTQYRIYGCVRVLASSGIVWYQGGLVAYLQEGDWYFTPHFLSYGSSTSPLRCTSSPNRNRE